MSRWADGRERCAWANPNNPRYIAYHDEEWGVPVHDDAKLFEMLLLECFQAGLSWECVLNKRDAFRNAFDEFDIDAICAYDEEQFERLMADPGIIRNKLKIRAAIQNARVFKSIQQEFGSFSAYLWAWTDGQIVVENHVTTSPLSDAISKDLKARGMKFVGSVTVYSYLQAVGVINSHADECFLAPRL